MRDSFNNRTAQDKSQDTKPILGKLMHVLQEDLAAGDLDRSRSRLRMCPPAMARAAVMQLGAPYLQSVRACAHARLDGKTGRAAAESFIQQDLRPIVTMGAQQKPPAPPKKPLLRRMLRSVGAVAMAIGLASPTLLHQTAPVQSEEVISLQVVQSDITELRNEFARTQLGRDMLGMAQLYNIRIVYDEALRGGKSAGTYNAGDKTVRMDPGLAMPEQVMFLAHELRHAWQDAILGYGEMETRLLTPQQRWSMRRYLEADAFAFSAYFMANRIAELPDAPQPGGNREMGSAAKLLAEFSSDDGLTNEEYRQHALERMFGYLGSYDDNHANIAQRSNNTLRDETESALDKLQSGDYQGAHITMVGLQARMLTTPSDEAFAEFLSRFGGMSLDLAAPTSLQAPAAPAADGTAPQTTAAFTPALAEEAAASSSSAVNARMAAAENLYHAYRALADQLTVFAREELAQARREGRPVSPPATENAAPKTGTQTPAPHKTDVPPAAQYRADAPSAQYKTDAAAPRIFPCRH